MLLTAPSHDFVQKLNLPAHTVNEKKKKKQLMQVHGENVNLSATEAMFLCSPLASLSCLKTNKERKLGSFYLGTAALSILLCKAQKSWLVLGQRLFCTQQHDSTCLASCGHGRDAPLQMSWVMKHRMKHVYEKSCVSFFRKGLRHCHCGQVWTHHLSRV